MPESVNDPAPQGPNRRQHRRRIRRRRRLAKVDGPAFDLVEHDKISSENVHVIELAPVCTVTVFGEMTVTIGGPKRADSWFVRLLDLSSLLFSAKNRERVWTPSAEELKVDFLQTSKKYRTKWARRWFKCCFVMQAILLLVETWRVSAFGLIWRMLPLSWQYGLRKLLNWQWAWKR